MKTNFAEKGVWVWCLTLTLCHLLNARASDCTPAPQGMVGWWKAETTAQDYALTNNATLVGGVAYATGLVGAAFDLHGGSDSVDIAESQSLILESFTIEGWIFPRNISTQQAVVEFSAPHQYGLHFWINLNGYNDVPGMIYANLRTRNASDRIIHSPPDTLRANEWAHIALTFNRNNGLTTLYCNGTNVAQGNLGTELAWTELPFHLGSRHGYYGFNGKLDEFTIYNRKSLQNN